MPANNIHREHWFERHISDHLDESWRVSNTDEGFDKVNALYMPDFLEFFEKADPEKAARYKNQHGGEWRKRLERALVKSLEKDGTILTLQKGFALAGFQTICCMAPYPDDPRIKGARERYDANILRFMHQVHYKDGNNSIDCVMLINGIPVATMEVKTELTQTVETAIEQYRNDRKPVDPYTNRKYPLLMYKRGAVVHFAVSENEIYMCTNLGDGTDKDFRPRFLPFNMGNDGHAGNPDAPEGSYRVHYLWDFIMRRDHWLSIFGRFVFEETGSKQDATGRWRETRTQIFPRFHQFECELKVMEDLRENGVGTNYLIEHSAGSGKTETITWTAYDLARMRDERGGKLFSSVVIVTDRISLDKNIKKTVKQLSNVKNQVMMIGRDDAGRRMEGGSNTRQLVKALKEHREIVVVTIQTFFHAWADIACAEELKGCSFAVIVDEAHSSQDGDNATALKTAFNAAADRLRLERMDDADPDEETSDEDSMNEYFRRMQAGNVMPANASFFAFTATPKAETKTLFGTPTGRTDEDGNPVKESFHLYPMRQAIEEGYIIDPLTGFLPMKTVTKLEYDDYDENRLVDERSAKRKIAKWNNLHPTNVTEKAEWIVEHFMHHVVSLLNCEAKAMIVTASRPAVIRYKYAIEAYLRAHPGYDRAQVERHLAFHVPGDPLMAFSGKVRGEDCIMEEDEYLKDNPFALIKRDFEYTEANSNPKGTGNIEKAFDEPGSKLLIVANKFQTGFDQKKLVAIYVDKPLGNNIEIVQTYSRVNRTYPGKDQVFVVDFVNDPEKVYRAFKTYDNGAKMSGTQDLNIVTDVKADLDAEGIYSEAELDGFKESLYRSKVAAADGGSDAYRAALYRAVEDPAARFNNAFLAAKDAYETNMQAKEDAEAAGDIERAAQAAMDVADAEQDVARLQTFKKKLSKYVSSYTFITQLVDLGEPDLEVFYSFAKLLSHKIKGSALDDVDITGLVLKDYRISEQKKPEREVEGEELQPMGAGGSGAAPRRDTIARIIDRLNQTWGSEGNPVVKARVVNHIADEVAADPVTVMRVTNSNNSKDAVLADDRLGNQVVVSLINLMSNEFASLADQALNDPQALEPLKEQVYDLIRSGRRIDIAELASYVAEHNGER